MAYSMNPYLPKVRAKAVKMLRGGMSTRQVARHFGVSPSAICKWNKKAPDGGAREIPTKSSRPHHHPRELDKKIVKRIVELRKKTKGRCGEVINQMLLDEGLIVSLSSVKRTLDRKGLTKKRSYLKRYHKPLKRPKVAYPGDLVEVDTIHLMRGKTNRVYIYSLLDLYSRWAYARAAEKITARDSVLFLNQAKKVSPFSFSCLQSDHGPEFSTYFTEKVKITHRHSRVRRPNDNAHLERFNRTLQEELLDQVPKNVRTINRRLKNYLQYYNQERLHLGLGLKTPSQMIEKCFQAID